MTLERTHLFGKRGRGGAEARPCGNGVEGRPLAAKTRAACAVRAVQISPLGKVLHGPRFRQGKWEECGTGMPANCPLPGLGQPCRNPRRIVGAGEICCAPFYANVVLEEGTSSL